MRTCLRKCLGCLHTPPSLLQRPTVNFAAAGRFPTNSGLCRRQAAPVRAMAPTAAAPPQAAGSGGSPPGAMEPRVLSSSFLSDAADGVDAGQKQLAVILLNWTLPSLTPQLWSRATLRVCADGGANRLFDELPRMLPGSCEEAVRAQYLPTAIKGDMDSIRSDVAGFYRQLGVPIHDLSEDQDSTDLQKCIEFVLQQAQEQQIQPQHLTLVALGALGGRLDHTLSNLSTLHAYRHLSLVLLGDGNLARLVPAGRCVIRPYRQLEGPTCGLVPQAGPAVASSRGLRWNLEDTGMQFGGLVSTSNIIEEDEIHVEADVDLVWTTRLRCSSGRAASPTSSGGGDASSGGGGGGGGSGGEGGQG